MWRLPKKEYGAMCHEICTRYANKIPRRGSIFYGDYLYEFSYDKRKYRITCTKKLKISSLRSHIDMIKEVAENEGTK